MEVNIHLFGRFLILIMLLSGCKVTDDHDNGKLRNQDIINYFENLVSNKDFSGIVLIGDRENISSIYCTGYSDFEASTEHTPDSKFAISSITKTFTAAAILHLKAEGKLALENRVGKFLPEFPYGDAITILNLLRHESGLNNVDYERLMNHPLSVKDLISEIGNKPLLFEPGTRGSYSNAGYSLLAAIVEKASGKNFERYLQENIFRPIGMHNTGDLTSPDAEMIISRAYFPDAGPEYVRKLTNLNFSLSFGSGSVYSTAEDLWKWGVYVMKRDGDFDFFSEEYPYGWGRDQIAGEFCLNQTGMSNGYVSSLFLFPEKEIVVVLLSNIENGLWVDWTKDIAKMIFHSSFQVTVPQKRKVYEGARDRGRLSEFRGTYFRDKDRYVDIKMNANGNLYLHLNSFYIGHYLTPVSSTAFELRSFTGTIKFERKDTLEWVLPDSWGGGSEIYVRQK